MVVIVRKKRLAIKVAQSRGGATRKRRDAVQPLSPDDRLWRRADFGPGAALLVGHDALASLSPAALPETKIGSVSTVAVREFRP